MNNLKRPKKPVFYDGGGKPCPSPNINIQARSRSRLSYVSILLVYSILSLVLQSQDRYASARLNFNRDQGNVFIPEPMEVSADSILKINQLTSTKYPSYSAGDCFQIEFEPIYDYITDEGVNTYEPFLDQPFSECNFTPASTCSRINSFVAQIYLDEAGSDLVGTFGTMRNPYSVTDLTLNKIRYYPGCVTTTEADATTFRNRALQFSFGPISDPVISVSQEIVGISGPENVAIFTFTPKTQLSPYGGFIEIKSPAWYGTSVFGGTMVYPFEGETECTASFIDTGLNSFVTSAYDFQLAAFTKSLKIEYATIKPGVSNTAQVTVKCKNWRNPITPELYSGFYLQTQDLYGYMIDATTNFNLDARSFVPYEFLKQDIYYTLSTTTIQKVSKLKFSFETDVPFEYDLTNGGCFFKFEFPDELVVDENLLTSYEVDNYLLQAGGDTAALPIADVSTLTGDADGKKYVVMKGCFQPVDSQVIQKYGGITFNSIINPYAKRDTGKFIMTVYRYYDENTKTLSHPIIQSTQSVMPASIFDTNQVESIVLTASNMIVQEKGTHTFEFTVKSIVPGTSNTDNEIISPAIHIFFPPTFEIDEDNQASDAVTLTGVTASGETLAINGAVQYSRDQSAIYEPTCQLDGMVCFLIEWQMDIDIPAGSRLTVKTTNLKNPECIAKVGNIIVTTMMKYSADPQFYKIDTSSQDPNFRPYKGQLDESLMVSSSPMENPDYSTNAANQLYEIGFTSKHGVKRDGWIRLVIPQAFNMTSASSAVALFRVRDEDSINHASVNSYQDGAGGSITGQITIPLEANKKYFIRIGGLRNPRYLVENSNLPADEQQLFTVKTYGSIATEPNDADNIIDSGIGAGIDITELSEIQTFSVEGYDTTNGVSTKYMITWFTETDTENKDYIEMLLPNELQMVTMSNANRELECLGKNGFDLENENENDQTAVTCMANRDNPQLLRITLNKVAQQTGLFKIELKSIRNAPSLRGSSVFAPIIQKTQYDQSVSQYSGTIKPIVTINDYASELLYLGSDNITQTSKEYSEEALYGISFEPFSKMADQDSEALTILLAYPNTVSPISETGCTVRAAKNLDGSNYIESDPANCNQIDGSRLFKITKAIPYGYDANVTIIIKFNNPKNNWGEIGFKVKTYEVVYGDDQDSTDDDIQYLVDMLEGNELIPNLKCTVPCKECKDGSGGEVVDKDYCTECWQDFPKKYLYTETPYNNGDGTGIATCNDQCPDGFTSNADPQHVCVACNPTCLTCADDGQKDDKDKCLTCPTDQDAIGGYKNWFIYSLENKCFPSCGLGYYQISETACDKCDDICADCVGDRFDCTLCHATSDAPALFTTSVITKVDGVDIEVPRSTCRSSCPNGYYMDRSNSQDIRCKPCVSPCSTCEGAADACLTCDGTDNLYYVYSHNCYVECPESTAPDLSNLQCIDCGPNCKECGLGESTCFVCHPPFLLENGECVVTCQVMGNYPNLDKTQCVNTKEFPVIYFPFSFMSGITLVIGYIAKKLKRETKVIPFIIAICGIIQWLAILFQMYLCTFYGEWKYFGFCALAFAILMLLNLSNYLYIQNNVVATDATKKVRLSQKKVDELKKEKKKKDIRDRQYQARVAEAQKNLPPKKKFEGSAQKGLEGNEQQLQEGGEIELRNFYDTSSSEEQQYDGGYDLDNLSDPGSSNSQKEGGSESDCSSDSDTYENKIQYEGGCFSSKKVLSKEEQDEQAREEKMLIEMGLIKEVNYLGFATYYEIKNIKDKGYIKWADAFEETAKYIMLISFINFKFYRMTYSFFMGRKQFLCLYQKKKYKKFMVSATLVSMFFVELTMIICDVVGALNLKVDTQIFYTFCDTFVLCIFMLVIQFVEIARLDKIMTTNNTMGHRANKSKAACASSDDSNDLSSDGDSEQDDYPDWRVMLKHVEGNQNLFHKTPLQRHLNNLEKKYDPKLRVAESCVDTSENPWQDYFNTGTEKEEDPRLTGSFPTTPKKYKEFDGPIPALRPLDATSDNCGFEAKEPGKKGNATYSEMGTQAMPSEILSALQRKGGDLLTPGLEKDDYLRKRTTKKKRGRKNKYYRQIDAEDDEEADQMSDGSDDDGLDGIKEEDDEDEDERKAKLAKIKAEKDRLAKEQAAREEAERKKKEAEEQARLEAERKAAEDEAKRQKKLAEEEEKKRMQEQNAKEAAEALNALRNKQASEGPKGASEADNASDLSKAMIKSTALQNFGDRPDEQIIEAPPKVESRRLNECDIIGNYDRDDKGNVEIGEPDKNGKYFDKDGKETNERGYLVDPSGNIINNYNGKKMFSKKDLDEKGEFPAPFNVEKHNFNPHEVRGHFDYDKNGNPIIKKDGSGGFVDKRGVPCSGRGYLIDKEGNIIDHAGRKKFDQTHVTAEGDMPKLFNYGGRRFDVTDTIGQLDKDANGQIIPLTDQQGKLTDNLGRPINSKGYLIDELGNIIDKDGRQIFEKKHLLDDEYPKIMPFSKFNVKNVLGDFEMDPLGQPILEKEGDGEFKDRAGQKVNSKGYMIDRDGNIINKDKKIMFPKKLLDNEQDIPKVFRTGLLKSDTASSLSRLMSEIGKNQPSEFDQEEMRIQEEIARNIKGQGQRRANSGNTSVDSMMEDTPANYNYQNQRFDADMEGDEDMEGDMDQQDEDDDDEYGSQYDQQMGKTGFTQDGVQELAKKRRKKKKKKKKRKPVEFEDPSLREHLLAGAYGGVAKRKPKRQGVKYTTDMNAGLRDIATPASAFMRDPSKKMMTSFSGFQDVTGHARDSSRHHRGQRVESSKGRSELGSQFGGSRMRGGRAGESTSKLLDPQQREMQLKQDQMNEIAAKRAAKIAAKKKRIAGGKPGKISQDADFEKMFGKDIDEFLEDSEWDIESIDKMSQFSKNSKNTIRSAAQAGKLRGLEKLYLQRIETGMNKNADQNPNAAMAGKFGQKPGKFRAEDSPQRKQAWETGSRVSKGGKR